MSGKYSTETSQTINDNETLENLLQAMAKATATEDEKRKQRLDAMKAEVECFLGCNRTNEAVNRSLQKLRGKSINSDPPGRTLKAKIRNTIQDAQVRDVLRCIVLPSLSSDNNWRPFQNRCAAVLEEYENGLGAPKSRVVCLKVNYSPEAHPAQGQTPESSKPEGQRSGSVTKSSREEPTDAHDDDENPGASGGGKICRASLTKAVASYESWGPCLAKFKFRGLECQNRCEGMSLLATIQQSMESSIYDYTLGFQWAFIGFPYGIEKDGCDLEIMFDGPMGILDAVPRRLGTNQYGVDKDYSVKSLPNGYTLDQTQWSFVREIIEPKPKARL